MSSVLKTIRELANFVYFASKYIKEEQIEDFLNTLTNAFSENRRILLMGAGRSGLVAKAFAMRLMHLGFYAYVLGETIVPSVRHNDLVIAISGSGMTKLVLTAAEVAKATGAKIVAITSYPESPLAKMADVVVEVPGRTKVAKSTDYFARQILGIHEPLAPLGTLFEITAMVFLDGVVAELMRRLGKEEEDLRRRHANIEL